jgi:hypothetical protein
MRVVQHLRAVQRGKRRSFRVECPMPCGVEGSGAVRLAVTVPTVLKNSSCPAVTQTHKHRGRHCALCPLMASSPAGRSSPTGPVATENCLPRLFPRAGGSRRRVFRLTRWLSERRKVSRLPTGFLHKRRFQQDFWGTPGGIRTPDPLIRRQHAGRPGLSTSVLISGFKGIYTKDLTKTVH